MERVRNGEIGWTVLDDLHRASLDELVEEFSLQALDEPERAQLNLAWHRLRPWPDSAAGLRRLRERFVVATLSNGNVALLVDLARHGQLRFDAIFSAELCRAYKPDPRVYRMACELLRLAPARVMMVAAHPPDLRAAAAEGLRTALVPRPMEWGEENAEEAPGAASAVEADLVARDLEDLAEQLGI